MKFCFDAGGRITVYVLLKQKLLPFRNTFIFRLINSVESNIYLPLPTSDLCYLCICLQIAHIRLITFWPDWIDIYIQPSVNWRILSDEVHGFKIIPTLQGLFWITGLPPLVFLPLSLPHPCPDWSLPTAQSLIEQAVSWPSSMASTHWEHRFVCWRKRACFEPSTWSLSMMTCECHLLAVPWRMCTMLSPPSCWFFFLILHHLLFLPLWYCFTLFYRRLRKSEFSTQNCHKYLFCVNSGNPSIKTQVFLFHLDR